MWIPYPNLFGYSFISAIIANIAIFSDDSLPKSLQEIPKDLAFLFCPGVEKAGFRKRR